MPVSGELRALQELLDANKENLPDGAYLSLMTHVRALYQEERTSRTFYQAEVVEVTPVSSRRVSAQRTTYLLEEVERDMQAVGPTAAARSWSAARTATKMWKNSLC